MLRVGALRHRLGDAGARPDVVHPPAAHFHSRGSDHFADFLSVRVDDFARRPADHRRVRMTKSLLVGTEDEDVVVTGPPLLPRELVA